MFILIFAIYFTVERKMVSPIGREVDRGGGSAIRQNQRVWEYNELLHKRVSERLINRKRNLRVDWHGGAWKEKGIQYNNTQLLLITRFFSHTILLVSILSFPSLVILTPFFHAYVHAINVRDKQTKHARTLHDLSQGSVLSRVCSSPHYRSSM